MNATDSYIGKVVPNKDYDLTIDPAIKDSDRIWITKVLDFGNGIFSNIQRPKLKVFLGTTHSWSLNTVRAENLWLGDSREPFPCSKGINDAYCAENNLILLIYSDIYGPAGGYRWDEGRQSTPAHELFHTVQYALGGPAMDWRSQNQELKIPRWLNEGGANFFGFYAVEKLGIGSYQKGRNQQLDSNSDYKTPIQLSEYSFSSLNPYGIGQGASEYLIASIGFEKFLNIWKFTNSESSFTLGFKKATGIDIEDFYAKFEAARTSIIPNSLPAPVNSSMPSPKPSPTITTVVVPKEIKSFQDAVDRPKDVSYWAWKKSSDQVLSNNTKGPIVELMVGPNTKLSNPDPASAISAATKMYPDFKSPEKVFVIYYSYADIDWAQKKYAEVYTNAYGQEAKNGCQKIEYCWGAVGTINSLGEGVILSAVMTSNPDKNHTSGTLEAHEYTHVLQISSFFGTGNQNQAMCCIKAFAPWWFVEGGANFSQLAIIYANSFDKYSEERKYEANDLLTNRDKKYTEKWIANFIKPPDTSTWREDGRESWHLYDLGMLVSEVFTAIKGPAINIQIFTDISNGMTFEKSFESHFGLPWDDAVKMIAKSISLLVEN